MAKYVIEKGGELEITGEINGGGADCYHFLCNRGLRKYMMNTPKEFSDESAGAKAGKYWVYVGPDALYFLHGLYNRFCRRFGENIRLPSVSTGLLKYGGSNQDEASAFIIALMGFRDFDRPARPQKEVEKEKIVQFNPEKGYYEEVEI